MKNRKILNATPVTSDTGIQMKSKAELMVYRTLMSRGIVPIYEGETFTYWKGMKPTIPFYDISKDRRLRRNMKKLIDMKYTPDFVFMYRGTKVIIEVKGFENDQFSIRKKMFRRYLETVGYPVVYAEIFTKRQLMEFLDELDRICPLKGEKTI